MKYIKGLYLLFYIYILIFSIGCTTKYIPVESIKTEYVNKVEKDTILIKDREIITKTGDTVYIIKNIIEYKIKNRIDTVLKTDTIPIIKEVEIIKEVNKIKDWQLALMVLGGVMVTVFLFKILSMFKV